MTINLRWFVSLFDEFKQNTPWYLKVVVGLILGVILSSGLYFAFFSPDAQPVVAAVPSTPSTPALSLSKGSKGSKGTPTWTAVPTQKPLPTETPLPTPIPVIHLVWSKQATAVNLRDAPAGNVITAIENGTELSLHNEVEEAGGYTWVKVEADSKTGWMANVLIWEMESGYRLLEREKDYYQSRNGAFVDTLPKGTPYQMLATQEGWIKVQLPDGEVGWIEG